MKSVTKLLTICERYGIPTLKRLEVFLIFARHEGLSLMEISELPKMQYGYDTLQHEMYLLGDGTNRVEGLGLIKTVKSSERRELPKMLGTQHMKDIMLTKRGKALLAALNKLDG